MNNAGTDVVGRRPRRAAPLGPRPRRRPGRWKGSGWPGRSLITGVATTAEIIVLDRDGLGLGSFSPPAKAHYQGYFLDHPEAVRGLSRARTGGPTP